MKQELMTLQEALNNFKVGDKLKRKEYVFTLMLHANGHFYDSEYKAAAAHAFTAEDLTSSDWQIIPAEPVVLSAEEIAKSVTYRDVNTYCWSDILQICETADKNGQLKRDRDYKELREDCEKLITYRGLENVLPIRQMRQSLKNIKPLEQ